MNFHFIELKDDFAGQFNLGLAHLFLREILVVIAVSREGDPIWKFCLGPEEPIEEIRSIALKHKGIIEIVNHLELDFGIDVPKVAECELLVLEVVLAYLDPLVDIEVNAESPGRDSLVYFSIRPSRSVDEGLVIRQVCREHVAD